MNPNGRVLILGGAAHQNRGDLAMQAGLVQWVRREAPDAEVLFFSSAPSPTSRAFDVPCKLAADAELATPWDRETATSTSQRKRAIRRGRRFVRHARRFRRWGRCPASESAKGFFSALREARCALVPGSGSMNSLWWHDWLYPKAYTVLAARAMGVPVAMTSQGVGPEFSHPLDAAVAAEMFSACEIVGVRDDKTSAGLLAGIGVDQGLVRHTGDDALLFESAHEPPTLGRDPGGAPTVGLNLRDSSTYQKGYAKHDPSRFARVLDAVASARPVRFAFVPISYDQQDDDRVAAQKVVDQMRHGDRAQVVTEELDAAQLRGLCGSFDAAIGISYHFLLFSLAASVPSLLLHSNPYYAHKSKGLSRLYGVERDAIDLGGTSDEQLESAIHGLLDGLDERRSLLGSANRELSARSDEARGEIARRLLRGAI